MLKYNILLITPRLDIGGEELSTIAIAEELMKRGHNVYYMSSGGPLLKELKRKNINYLKGRVEGRGLIGIIRGAIEIRKALNEFEINIVHCPDPREIIMSYIATNFIFLNKHNKIIWHDRRTRFYPFTARMMNIFADFVIANSNFERQRLIKNGLISRKVRTIHNCLNLSSPQNDLFSVHNKNGPLVGTVGRLISIKGHKYFIEAATEIRSSNPEAKFLIVGDGLLKTNLEEFAAAKGLGHDIEFVGFKRNLNELYSSIDIFVNPSLYESFGNTCLEAMAFGKPVVASKVGGVTEIVEDGITGILIPPKDSKKIAEAVIYLLKNPEVARRMGEAGRKRVQEYFTFERLGNELEEVYEFVMMRKQ